LILLPQPPEHCDYRCVPPHHPHKITFAFSYVHFFISRYNLHANECNT
jgi:hypothetical protein